MPRNQAVKKENLKATPPQPGARRRVESVRSRRGDLNAAEQTVGQDRPRVQRAAGPARNSLEPALIETVDRVVSKEKLDALAFMEEPVKVVVHTTTNETDEPIPVVWNGGIQQAFIRGEEQVVKRKFVEILARAKRTVFSQERLPDNNGYKQVPRTALRYPFAVVEDRNPKGAAWLKSVLAEA